MSNNNPIDERLGLNVRKRRLLQGMTQEALGSALDKPVGASQIVKYEQGVDRIPARTIYEFSKVFGVQVGIMYEGIGECLPSESGELSRNDAQVLSAYRHIEQPEIRDAVKNLVRALAIQISDS